MSFDLNVNVTTRIPVQLAGGCSGCNGCGKVEEKSNAVKPKAYEKTFISQGFYIEGYEKRFGEVMEHVTFVIDPKRVKGVKFVDKGPLGGTTIIKGQYQEPRDNGLKALYFKLPAFTKENGPGRKDVYYLQVERKDGSKLNITLKIKKFLEEESDVVESEKIEITAKSFDEAAQKTLAFQGFYIERYEKRFGEVMEHATVVIHSEGVKNVKFIEDRTFTDIIHGSRRQETRKDGSKALYFELPYLTKDYPSIAENYNTFRLLVERNDGTVLGVTLKVDADPEE